jgi:hypothetical protein
MLAYSDAIQRQITLPDPQDRHALDLCAMNEITGNPTLARYKDHTAISIWIVGRSPIAARLIRAADIVRTRLDRL